MATTHGGGAGGFAAALMFEVADSASWEAVNVCRQWGGGRPGVGGVDFAGRYRAALDTDRVSGDFYDVHPPDDEREETLVVLGDVCGKGLEAAVLTGKIRTTVRALLPLANDHQRLLRLLNGALLGAGGTRFATLVLASVGILSASFAMVFKRGDPFGIIIGTNSGLTRLCPDCM